MAAPKAGRTVAMAATLRSLTHLTHHSARSAIMGSIRVARRAGT